MLWLSDLFQGIWRESEMCFIHSWTCLKSSLIVGWRGITASSGEDEEIFVWGETSWSVLASCSSKDSCAWGNRRKAVGVGEHLPVYFAWERLGACDNCRWFAAQETQYGHWRGPKGTGGGIHRFSNQVGGTWVYLWCNSPLLTKVSGWKFLVWSVREPWTEISELEENSSSSSGGVPTLSEGAGESSGTKKRSHFSDHACLDTEPFGTN